MKISAINGLTNSYINFEGKKRDTQEIQKPVHSSSPLKAIPLAALIAMSPLNAPGLNAQQAVIVQTTQQNKILGSAQYENATPYNNYNCTLRYISNDNDDSTVEKIQFIFDKTVKQVKKHDRKEELYAYRYLSNIIDFSTLKKINITTIDDEGNIKYSAKYYVEGPGTKYTVVKDLQGDVVSRNYHSEKNIKMEITKNFFEDLKSVIDKSINYIEENRIYDEL